MPLGDRPLVQALFKFEHDLVLVVAPSDEYDLVFSVAKSRIPVLLELGIACNIGLLYVFLECIDPI